MKLDKKSYRIAVITLSLIISNILFFNLMRDDSSQIFPETKSNEEDFTIQAQSLVKLTALKEVTIYSLKREKLCDGIFIQVEKINEDFLSGTGDPTLTATIRLDKLCAMKRLPKTEKILIGPRSNYQEKRLTEVDYEIHF